MIRRGLALKVGEKVKYYGIDVEILEIADGFNPMYKIRFVETGLEQWVINAMLSVREKEKS